ncbi:MAG: FHA domain-containing protein [Desulfobacterales bacterium]|nr:FHA domain-containing protein [Desulfobacterales bacterium]
MDTAMTLALEVIGGPMDGLRTCIRDNKSPTLIGRQVGNHLTLPMDMTVSRWHTNVSKQGNAFYLTDDKSLAGTWHNGSRISKIKLAPGMMLKVGGTLIEVIEIPGYKGDVSLEDGFFNDPPDTYRFSDTLKTIWSALKGKNNYIDVSDIFAQPDFYSPKKLNMYDGMKKICGPDLNKIISSWTGAYDVNPRYRFPHKGQFMTPPRVWAILDIASQGNTKEIDSLGFIRAVLKEERSPAARILSRDTAFVQGLANNFCAPEKKPDTVLKAPEKSDPVKTILAGTLMRMETIVSGFIEDAVSSGLAAGSPHKASGLEIDTVLDAQGQSDLAGRVEQLEKNMVAVLAAHRDALSILEKELGDRIIKVIDHDDRKGLFPSLSNQNPSLLTSVKRVLKEAELEGLGACIVRQIIKNKVIS